MTKLKLFDPFASKQKNRHIQVECITEKKFKSWLNEQSDTLKEQINEQGFSAKSGEIVFVRNAGKITEIYAGAGERAKFHDGANIQKAIESSLSGDTLQNTTFSLSAESTEQTVRLYIGWAWGCYVYDTYKKENREPYPKLVITKNLNKKHIRTVVEAVCLVRDLINTPANDMGPEELEAQTRLLCDHHGLKLKAITDKDLLKQNFPMIFNVGRASTRRPRLLDFTWGTQSHPKVTLVGKGVCFDTGGLDIKPSEFMLTMKKDMGGAAHVLGLAHMIISLNLPVNLRVLIPAVENSIDGNAYRPSDVLPTRKGITVEIGNTDAEGRLVLSDALTYACEENPELIIDFATLTGAARVALGLELPALFSNNGQTAYKIQNLSATDDVDDPVWNLPLWQPYRDEINSKIADIKSTGGKAGATTAALYLEEFIENDIEWIHLDVFAWEQKGKAECPQGGSATGMRAIFAFLEERYGKK